MSPKNETSKKNAGSGLWASTLGIHLVVLTAAGVAGGWFIDKWLHTAPVFTMICFCLGIAGGIYEIYKTIKRLADNEKK